MTRRPIFIGVATVLALALTAGLAYGAGRLVRTQGPTNQAGHQQRIVGVVPGYFFGSNGQAGFRSGMGPSNHSRGWMGSGNRFGGWMGSQNHFGGWARQPGFLGRQSGQRGNQTGPGPANGSYQGSGYGNHPSGYPHYDNHGGSGTRGNGSGYNHDCCGWC